MGVLGGLAASRQWKTLKILQFNANISIGLKARKTGFLVTFPVTCDVEVRTRNQSKNKIFTELLEGCLR